MSNHCNNDKRDEKLEGLFRQHATPEALAEAEACAEFKLAEAAAENQRFLRES